MLSYGEGIILKFKILHTNDVHSRFENFAKIVTKINELRDENTLILDAGDFNDFMRLELQGTNGRAGAELLSLAGYDAIAVGNNEGFEGIKISENLASSGNTTFLSCNLYKLNNSKLDQLRGIRRSIIIERGGIKFLIIGSSPYGSYNEFYSLLNMHSTDAKEEIKKELESNKGFYDICILLSHCGMREDTEIANSIEGIDIIVNGHSHILMNGAVKINNSVVHMSGQYGEHLGILEVEYHNGIIDFKGENIDIKDIPEAAEIDAHLRKSKKEAIRNLSESLYEIDEDLWHDVVEENPMTNLLADALKDLLNCEVGIINSGVLNGGIRKGDVSRKKLLEICPSPLNPTIIEIQGKYIRQAFEQSLKSDFCMMDGKGAGFRGKYLGRLHIAGGQIEFKGNKIERILVGVKELEDESYYKVATSDYLQRGTGYPSLSKSKLIKYNAEYLRDTLKEYLCKKEFINNALEDRWIRL